MNASEMSEQVYDRDYAHLVHYGFSSNTGRSLDGKPHPFRPESDNERRIWKFDFAHTWWRAMEERAERDGLLIECYTGHDNAEIGWESADARLRLPDVYRYRESDDILAALREWGEALIAARERHPYPG